LLFSAINNLEEAMKQTLAIACSVGFAALGCASTPEPREEMGRAKLAVEQAERSGGTQHAELEMKLSHEKLAAANRSLEAHDYELARRSAEQAEVDARLALVKARRAEANTADQELKQTIQAMQEEIQHGTH
jgi:chromosome segregation ATPase